MFFKLLGNSGVSTSATRKISWCVDEAFLHYLAGEGIKNPHVLLIVVNARTGREYRQLANLDDGYTFLQFHGSGKNVVHALLVWDPDKGRKEKLESKFLSRDRYVYDRTMIDFDTKEPLTTVDNTIVFDGEHDVPSLEFDIDKKYFANYNRNSWWYRYANLWHKRKPVDQCDVKKRVLLSILKTPLVLFFLLIKIPSVLAVGLFWAGLGSRGVEWGPLFHPFRDSFETVYSGVMHGKWWGWGATRPYLWFFKPTILFFVALCCLAFGNIAGDVSLWRSFTLAFGVVSLSGFWIFSICAVVLSIDSVNDFFDELNRRKHREVPSYEETMEHLLCSQVSSGTAKIKRPMYRLFWERVKAPRCRPLED